MNRDQWQQKGKRPPVGGDFHSVLMAAAHALPPSARPPAPSAKLLESGRFALLRAKRFSAAKRV